MRWLLTLMLLALAAWPGAAQENIGSNKITAAGVRELQAHPAPWRRAPGSDRSARQGMAHHPEEHSGMGVLTLETFLINFVLK